MNTQAELLAGIQDFISKVLQEAHLIKFLHDLP
jgi:hypothetical protein